MTQGSSSKSEAGFGRASVLRLSLLTWVEEIDKGPH